jgi:hypothetical protein
MATRKADPNNPGQFQVYNTDLILCGNLLTYFQRAVYQHALQYEWDFGHAPEGIVWTRFERAVNQHQKAEIEDLARRYESLPLTAKMREQRAGKLKTKAQKVGVGSQVGSQVGSSSALNDNPNVINENAPEDAGKRPPSSNSSNSSSSKNKTLEEKKEKQTVSVAPTVRLVFAYWQSICQHPDAKLTTKRERAIGNRVREGYTLEDLKAAIDGCRASPWHQGANDRHEIYDDLELICRSGEKVEHFKNILVGGQSKNGSTHTTQPGTTASGNGHPQIERFGANPRRLEDFEPPAGEP